MKLRLLLLLNFFVVSCIGIDLDYSEGKGTIELAQIIESDDIQKFSEFLNKFRIKIDSTINQYGIRYPLLSLAAKEGAIKIADFLISNGADIDEEARGGFDDGMTALAYAVMKNHSAMVKLLLEKKAKVNVGRVTSRMFEPASRPLHLSLINIEEGQGDAILKFLVKHGAEILQKDIDFARKLSPEIVELLELYADPKAKEELHKKFIEAASNGDAKVVKEIIERTNVNYKDEDGITALMKASQGSIEPKILEGKTEIVKLLLKAGAYPNLQDSLGNTALIFAAENNHPKIVELLLEKKANQDLHDKKGNTALKIAKKLDHKEVVAILEKYRSQPEAEKKGEAAAEEKKD